MTRNTTRTLAGAALMLALIPAIVGLLACMPVPIGDPERSHIDPAISGVWHLEDEGLYAFEPWDKRTWVLTGVSDEAADEDLEMVVFKAWRSKHGGEWFMTWEPRIDYDNEDFDPEMWFVFRIEKPADDRLDLHMVNGDHDLFKEAQETRRAYEKVLRKNARNPEIYVEEPTSLLRATFDQVSLFYEQVNRVIDHN